MALILIAACAGKKQVIGQHGRLPWHFSADLKFFKQTTLDQTLLMGRTTYDAIIEQFGRPLPRRRILIVSRDQHYRPETGEVYSSIPAALAAAPDGADIYVAGGAQLYCQTLPQADAVLLTHIEQEIEGDTFFPSLPIAEWHCVSEKKIEENNITLRFCRYHRP